MSRKMLGLIVERRRWFGLMTALFFMGVGWIALSAIPHSDASGDRLASPRQGFLAPDFRLERLGGGNMALSEQVGKVVVLNFWASWCSPCRAEMPALQRVYEAYRDQGLQVLAVNTTYQDSETAAADFVQERRLSFPILLERSGNVARRYQIRAMPTTFFIDREGVIRGVIIGGPLSQVTLQTKIDALLSEAP